jgi:acetyl esterase/lipase
MRAVAFFLLAMAGCAVSIPRDDSFTAASAFEKERGRFPFIRIAEPRLPDGVAEQRNIVYASRGARKLRLDIFHPESGVDYPGVLMVHGGGWRSGDRSMEIPLAQQLAARGYVVAAVEYRLSPETRYPAAVHDIKAAVRWLRANAAQYRLDPRRIAVSGESAGGQLAALVGYTGDHAVLEDAATNDKYSSAVQAVIDIDGLLDFTSEEARRHEDDPNKNPSSAGAWFGGRYVEKPELWKEASPLYYVNAKSPPTLFINSSIPRFHVGRDEVIEKLKRHGIYSDVHTFPETPHTFWLFHPWFEPTVELMAKFLDRWFKENI